MPCRITLTTVFPRRGPPRANIAGREACARPRGRRPCRKLTWSRICFWRAPILEPPPLSLLTVARQVAGVRLRHIDMVAAVHNVIGVALVFNAVSGASINCLTTHEQIAVLGAWPFRSMS